MQMFIGTKEQPVTISFPQVFEPKAMEPGALPKYGVQILLHKVDDANIINQVNAAIDNAIVEAINKGKLKKAQTVLPKFRRPMRDGDVYAAEGEAEGKKNRDYAKGHMLISANCGADFPPVIVDRFGKHIGNAMEIYGGVKAIVTVNFYGYDVRGNSGIAAGFNGLMKRAEGNRMDGMASAASFNQFADDEDAEAISSYEQAATANETPEGQLV